MVMTLLASFLLLNVGYQPRHRSTHQPRARAGRVGAIAGSWEQSTGTIARPAGSGSPDYAAWSFPAPAGPAGQPRQPTAAPLRRMLEGRALADVARILPELVNVIAHGSHTRATLARAWADFRVAVTDAHELDTGARRWWDFFSRDELGPCPDQDALEIKLGQADRAWRLITDGVA
jgi:hypothetical protein